MHGTKASATTNDARPRGVPARRCTSQDFRRAPTRRRGQKRQRCVRAPQRRGRGGALARRPWRRTTGTRGGRSCPSAPSLHGGGGGSRDEEGRRTGPQRAREAGVARLSAMATGSSGSERRSGRRGGAMEQRGGAAMGRRTGGARGGERLGRRSSSASSRGAPSREEERRASLASEAERGRRGVVEGERLGERVAAALGVRACGLGAGLG